MWPSWQRQASSSRRPLARARGGQHLSGWGHPHNGKESSSCRSPCLGIAELCILRSQASWPLPYVTGVVVFHTIYAAFELKRYQNFQKYGETGLLNSVPFDPLGQLNDGTRQKEVCRP